MYALTCSHVSQNHREFFISTRLNLRETSESGQNPRETQGFCVYERARGSYDRGPRPPRPGVHVYMSHPYTGGGFLEFKEMVEENSKDKRRKRLHQKELKSKYPYEGRYTKPRQRSYNRSQGKHNNTQEN